MEIFSFFNFLFRLQADDVTEFDKNVSATVESTWTLFNIPVMDDDFWKLLFKFTLNLFILFVLVRLIYYPTTRRKDYLFTYFLIGIITFFICVALKSKSIDTGMALGLFAIFSIIRYRTDAIPIKEMTYLFVVIGISVINALAGKDHSHVATLFMNLVIVAIVFGFERVWFLKHESSRLVLYEKIELIKPARRTELIKDLEERTGLKINRVSIGKIDFMRDTAQVMIFYFEDSINLSDYTNKGNSGDDADD
jgi:hypothetical protein